MGKGYLGMRNYRCVMLIHRGSCVSVQLQPGNGLSANDAYQISHRTSPMYCDHQTSVLTYAKFYFRFIQNIHENNLHEREFLWHPLQKFL